MAKMACAKCGMTMKKGGAKPKKMATGGVTLTQKGAGYAKATTGGTNGKMGIYGMPQENMGTSGQYGKMAKGGAFAPNRAVQASCKNGMVRDENGRCVMQRKMKVGGATAKLSKAQDGTSVKAGPLTEKDAKMLSTSPLYKDTNKAYGYFSSGMQPTPSGYRVTPQGRMDDKEKEIRSGATFKKGGMTKAKKFAALAPPYNKATAADRIAGAKKNKRK